MGYERDMDYSEDISLTSSIEAVLGYSIHLSNLVGIHITYHIITHWPTATPRPSLTHTHLFIGLIDLCDDLRPDVSPQTTGLLSISQSNRDRFPVNDLPGYASSSSSSKIAKY